MSLATLAEVLHPALASRQAVAGLVVLGWEDARAFVAAGEAENLPIILQAGPGCRAHTPIKILGEMFRHLADNASVPVVAHLDHAYSRDECEQALEAGFSSVMFDGSSLPLDKNIKATAEIAKLAHDTGASCEGEIGYVGYDEGRSGVLTDPQEAALFAKESGIDAMAVSVGNIHLQQEKHSAIDLETIRKIEALTSIPLVLHGGSGIDPAMRQLLATQTNVCKFNIGTELRMAFGQELRRTLAEDPLLFDRIAILKKTEQHMQETTRRIIRTLAEPMKNSPKPYNVSTINGMRK